MTSGYARGLAAAERRGARTTTTSCDDRLLLLLVAVVDGCPIVLIVDPGQYQDNRENKLACASPEPVVRRSSDSSSCLNFHHRLLGSCPNNLRRRSRAISVCTTARFGFGLQSRYLMQPGKAACRSDSGFMGMAREGLMPTRGSS